MQVEKKRGDPEIAVVGCCYRSLNPAACWSNGIYNDDGQPAAAASAAPMLDEITRIVGEFTEAASGFVQRVISQRTTDNNTGLYRQLITHQALPRLSDRN